MIMPGNSTASVFNIQRYSLHDGPGLRTVVFLKGCPLHCPWCSNPESQLASPQVFYNRERCMRCGACRAACPNGCITVGDDGFNRIDRERCDGCSGMEHALCESVCVCEAIKSVGTSRRASDIFAEVVRDEICFRKSGGGLTLSGGEPLLHAEFCCDLLRLCHLAHIATAIETTGFVRTETIRRILPFTDLFLYDIKHTDGEKHRRVIGADNALILENLRYLRAMDANVIVRIPLIPGFNADLPELFKIRDLAISIGVREIHLLPYHIWGENKYAFLDRAYGMHCPAMDGAEAERIAQELVNDKCVIRVHG